jgi:hypothetical protein
VSEYLFWAVVIVWLMVASGFRRVRTTAEYDEILKRAYGPLLERLAGKTKGQ